MAKVLRTLRTHWKKSIFFSGLAAYGVNYGKNKFEEKLMMKAYCKEAVAYGEPSVPVSHIPYHVTVVLNPAACGGKGRVRFDTYCAPLLHLAGIKVSVIRTEGEGQAKDILEVVKDCDAVLIAGGDGTLMEAVTGLMRRQATGNFKIPIGLLPVGTENRMARNLFPISEKFSEVRLMAEATMSVVRQLYMRPVDVIEVENVSDEQYGGKKIYGIRQIQTGAFRDTESRLARYWYFAGLKKYMAYIFAYTTSAKDIFWSVPGTFETLLEPEKTESEDDSEANQSNSQSWSDWLRSKVFGAPEKEHLSNRSDSDSSQNVGTWQTLHESFNGVEFTIQSANDFPLTGEASRPVLNLTLAPAAEDLSFFQFVKEGWRRQRAKPISVFPDDWQKAEARTLLWTPSQENSDSENAEPARDRHFNLDSESIDMKGSIKISLLPARILMFCAPETYYSFQRPEETQVNQKKWWRRTAVSRASVATPLSMSKPSF